MIKLIILRENSESGKTVLINLLMRFYDINGRKILLDGEDQKDMILFYLMIQKEFQQGKNNY